MTEDRGGCRFDRTCEAAIDDCAWSADRSRSTGFDIRHVLGVTEKLGRAAFLPGEIGVSGGR